MSHRTIEINGAEMTFLDEGTGDPIVLINGLLGDYRTWQRQVESFAARHRVIALSQRYYFPNRWPDDGAGFGVRTHADDIVAFVQQMQLPPIHLVGHSYGGGVAAQVAMEHPHLVRSLILAEPSLASLAATMPEVPGLMAKFAASRQRAFDDWQNGNHERAVEDHLLFVFGAAALDRIRDAHFVIMAENGAILSAAYRPRPPAPPVTCAQVRKIRAPILLIEGSATKAIFRETCAALRDCLPALEHVLLDGASHALAMEMPAPFNSVVLRFLADK